MVGNEKLRLIRFVKNKHWKLTKEPIGIDRWMQDLDMNHTNYTLGIKLHYNSDYDFNRYNGKVSASFESYLKRNDKFQFAKLRKQHNGQLKDFYISNFMYKDFWVGDLFGEEAKQNYTEWKKYNQSLLYSFEKDIRHLNSLEGKLDNLFNTNDF
jgi:hypothetical protein